MITLSDNAMRMIASVIGASTDSFLSVADCEDQSGDNKVFAEEAVKAFKDNPFVLFQMANNPDDSSWTYATEKRALDLLISRSKTLESLVLLYYALPPNMAYSTAETEDGHPNDHHFLIVSKMVDVCKDSPRKLWFLFEAFKYVDVYRELVVEQINKLAASKSKPEEKNE